jgi:hypothetical protein
VVVLGGVGGFGFDSLASRSRFLQQKNKGLKKWGMSSPGFGLSWLWVNDVRRWSSSPRSAIGSGVAGRSYLIETGVFSTMSWRVSERSGYSLERRAVGGCLSLRIGFLGILLLRRLLFVGSLCEVWSVCMAISFVLSGYGYSI